MSIALTLLDDVRWHGVPVIGERPQALLAALAARDCRPVAAADLPEALRACRDFLTEPVSAAS